MNLQVIADPGGGIVWVSGPLLAAVHDLTVARIWVIIRELAASGLVALGDKGYIGEDGIRTPYRGAEQACPAEGGQPGSWPAPRPWRTGQCPAQVLADLAEAPLLPWRAGQLAEAIHVLQTREIG